MYTYVYTYVYKCIYVYVCVCVLISKLVEHNAWPSPRCHFDSFACVVTPRVLLSFTF